MPFFNYFQSHIFEHGLQQPFTIDLDRGIGHLVIIEAETSAEANAKALTIGLYFDGMTNGIDPPISSRNYEDRWYENFDDEGYPMPVVNEGYRYDEKTIFIHYADGSMRQLPHPLPEHFLMSRVLDTPLLPAYQQPDFYDVSREPLAPPPPNSEDDDLFDDLDF